MAASKADEAFGKILASVGVCLFAIGVAVFGFQIFQWLREGSWTYIDVGDAWKWIGLGGPTVRAAGAERILAWVLAAPFAGAAAIIGGLCIWLGLAIVER
ncbi:MAG: hypothetical protein U1E56_11065 [Bauldia sp.]